MLAAIAAKHGGERRQHAGTDETDAQRAELAASNAARLGEVLADAAQRAPRAFEKDFAGSSQFDRRARCVETTDAR